MHRFGVFAMRRSLGARVLFVLLPLAAAVLTVGAAAGQARTTDAPPPAVREHGRGHWFRHACSLPETRFAWCGAQVVTNSGGVPLASSSPPSSALTPAAFHSAYGVPTTAAVGTPTIAIVDAYDDPNIESDLAAYSQQFGLPACTTANGCFRKVDQNGGTSYPSGTSWHLEIALDVEIAHAMCQNCKIVLVEAATASMANLGRAENTAVSLGASVVSNSYGGGEFSGETSYDSTYFKHPGVAITVSSGDSGYGVEYPAASQYVTAVGGTTLTLNSDKSYKSEAAWSGAGSGCSAYEPKPSWQKDTGCANRTVADVSADADPNSGAAIYDSIGTPNGQAWYQVGGTSLSAPLVGSIYALTGTTTTYGSAPYAQPTLLNDVTSGSNGSCSSAYLCTGVAGYDGPTGLGTPHGLGAFGGSAPAADYSLSLASSTATAVKGAQASFNVTVAPANGFTGAVTFGTTGLPGGTSATFTPASSTSGATLTVDTSTLAAGTYPFSITGSSGGLNHSVSATLVVQDFSLSVAPSSQTVTAGTSTTYTVSVTPGSGGLSGSVAFSAAGLPAGASGSFSGSTLTVTTSASMSASTSTITVTGTSGGVSRTATAQLVVQAAVAADFSLSPAQPSQTVTAGGQTAYTISVVPTGGFTSAVSITAQGTLPTGVGVSFSPSSATPTTPSTMTVTTTTATPPSTYTLTVQGTSGVLTHTTSVKLVVNAPATPDFSLSTPAAQTVVTGAGASYQLTVTGSNGFTSPVTLSLTGLPQGGGGTFTTNPVTPGGTSTLNVTTASVAAGTYLLTITGMGGSPTVSHSVTANLVVQDFSLGLSPSSQTVAAGSPATFSVTESPLGGFAAAVNLTVSGLPQGVSASFNPNPPAPSSTLTLTPGSAVAAGTYPFTVTGTGGSLVRTVQGTLVVTKSAGPTLTVSPTSAARGTNVTVTWSGVTSPSSMDWIGIFNPGASNQSYLQYEYDSSCAAGRLGPVKSAGSCAFKLPNKAGTYEFRLMANNGFTPIVTGVIVTAT